MAETKREGGLTAAGTASITCNVEEETRSTRLDSEIASSISTDTVPVPELTSTPESEVPTPVSTSAAETNKSEVDYNCEGPGVDTSDNSVASSSPPIVEAVDYPSSRSPPQAEQVDHNSSEAPAADVDLPPGMGGELGLLPDDTGTTTVAAAVCSAASASTSLSSPVHTDSSSSLNNDSVVVREEETVRTLAAASAASTTTLSQDDVAAAFAAVAAAASANIRSPSAAAAAARTMAPGVVPAATIAAISPVATKPLPPAVVGENDALASSTLTKKEVEVEPIPEVRLASIRHQMKLLRAREKSKLQMAEESSALPEDSSTTTKLDGPHREPGTVPASIVSEIEVDAVDTEKAKSRNVQPGGENEKNESILWTKVVNGENNCFLRYILMLSSVKISIQDEEESAIQRTLSNDDDDEKFPHATKKPAADDESVAIGSSDPNGETSDYHHNEGSTDGELGEEDGNDESSTLAAAQAAAAVNDILAKAEQSYDTLIVLLPPLPEALRSSTDDPDEGGEGDEPMAVVPDLLPPCTTAPDDATAEFFRACSENYYANDDDKQPVEGGATGESIKKGHGKAYSGTTDSVENAGSTADGVAVGKGTLQNGTSPSSNASVQSSAVQVTASSSPSPSVFSSVISSVKKHGKHQPPASSPTKDGIGSVFRKRRSPVGTSNSTASVQKKDSNTTSLSSSRSDQKKQSSSRSLNVTPENGDVDENDDSIDIEYTVQIDREMLGLTVENVLERTVVRTVLPGGAAKKAGAKVGSLIVKVGSVETKNLTHFETIDELRQSQRPLKLVLRRISREALKGARDEMGRLIRGGGFGVASSETELVDNSDDCQDNGEKKDRDAKNRSRGLRGEFESLLSERWVDGRNKELTKKDGSLSRVEGKLVWLLTLLVIGLEREAAKLAHFDRVTENASSVCDSTSSTGEKQIHHRNQHHHTAKDYADAAKSVSKTLLDYAKLHLEAPASSSALSPQQEQAAQIGMQHPYRRGRKGLVPPHQPHLNPMGRHLGGKAAAKRQQHLLGMPGGTAVGKRTGPFASGPGHSPSPSPKVPHSDSPLLQIGDVLHRTRTFLAEPSSPPAALLRGETIALLCDILDIDTDMQLSEEESASSIAGHKAGPINDLGSAGSLLKLIVLNCSLMRSPDCVAASRRRSSRRSEVDDPSNRRDEFRKQKDSNTPPEGDAHRLHAGNRFLAVVHRLAASRSTSARVTACSLGPVLWGHLDFPHQLQLRGVITRALHDVEVIVRKSTATVLHEIAELVFDPRAVPWLVLMCERAMTDPEPQLRAAAMTLTWHLAEHLPNAFLGDASKGSRSLRRLPARTDPTFAEVYLLQCKLLPVATRLAEDRAPSVRLAVAAQCDRLCNALGDHWFSVIIDLLQALLGDSDERVRSEAALCMPRLVESVLLGSSGTGTPTGGVSVFEALLPVAIKLLKDPSTGVRVALATAAGELLTLLVGLESLEEMNSSFDGGTGGDGGYKRHKKHVDETLIPLVQRLLHDSDPEVTSAALRAVTNASRGNVREISSRRPQYKHRADSSGEDDTMSLSSYQSHASIEKKEPVFIPVLSEKQVLRLLPTLSDLATSAQWRVRQSAVEIVPALLGCTHRLETRSEIAQLCVQLMGDTVDAVRRAAAECLCLGGGSLGGLGEESKGEWITAIVIPHLRTCRESTNSKQRMLSLKMVEVILLNGVCPTGVIETVPGEGKSPIRVLVELAGSLSNDRVVNVRLNVGRVLGNVVSVLEEEELAYIILTLEQQVELEQSKVSGGDRDVLYFAKRAISFAQMRLEDISLVPHDDLNRQE